MKHLLFLTLLFSSHVILAKQVSPARPSEIKEAVGKTKNVLVTPQLRKDALSESPEAQKLDGQMRELFKDEKSMDEFYKLAAEVFEKMATETDGDPEKMQALLESGRQDPEAFAKKLQIGGSVSELSKKAAPLKAKTERK